MHTEHYTRPRLQRHVIRVLWMVPIYSVDAWLALRFVDARVYLDPVRECYEAYAIYSFYAYLMSFLEDELGDVDAYLATRPQVQHLRFVARLGVKPWPMGAPFLYEVKKGVANYVIARPVCTALAAITDAFGVYGEGQLLSLTTSYPYLALATNFSQAWALYCLVLFYKAFSVELRPIRPLAKFVCIKAVVFLTFWQGLALHFLAALGFFPEGGEQVTTYSAADVAEGFQDFLICIEMFVASVAHSWAFSYRDYRDPALPTAGFRANLRSMFDLRDVARDVVGVVEGHLSAAAQGVAAAAGNAGGVAAEGARGIPRALAKAAGAGAGGARGIYQHLVGGGGGGEGGSGGGGGGGVFGEQGVEGGEEAAASADRRRGAGAHGEEEEEDQHQDDVRAQERARLLSIDDGGGWSGAAAFSAREAPPPP